MPHSSTSTNDDARWILPFTAVDRHALPRVGGKGANLGEMTRAGFPVPPGFCVTTDAFRAFMASPALDGLFMKLANLDVTDVESVRVSGEEMRRHLLTLPIPPEVEDAVLRAWSALGEDRAFAVRSSATAEDLPGASFAGQQDTYLNVIGRAAILDRMRACWASLFTDRAITYRGKNGFDHRLVYLCVVVQRLVRPSTAGIMFTADPINGRRHVVSIDAGFGLGEALVSGLVSADLYKVDKRSRAILDKKIADKKMAILPVEGGGTVHKELGEAERRAQVLEDEQIVSLAGLGARVEAHYGAPQDIEWCIEAGELFLVQARPITTLYPIPQRNDGGETTDLRVFVSFGHAQVMTDVMAPFAHSIWKKLIPFGRDARGESAAVLSAGSRIYLDPTELLRFRPLAMQIPKVLRVVDEQTARAVEEVVQRDAWWSHPRSLSLLALLGFGATVGHRIALGVISRVFFVDPDRLAQDTRNAMDASHTRIMQQLEALPDDAARLRAVGELWSRAFTDIMLPIMPSIIGGGVAGILLRKLVHGDPADLEAIGRGLDGNVTTEMDLQIGDLADILRNTPALAERVRADPALRLEDIARLEGAGPFVAAFRAFLEVYGVRGGSEIDVTRVRWGDDPTPLLQVIRGNLARAEQGAHRAHHAKMKREGEAAAQRIIDGTSALKRPLVRRLVRAYRALTAIREHPKFQLVRTFGLTRAVALSLGRTLHGQKQLEAPTDVWFLTMPELHELLGGGVDDVRTRVATRRAELVHHARLTPPRVMTTEGECVTAKLARGDLPAGALGGTGASAGIVEGIARVVLDPNKEVLHAGEILVAPFTDPGWTPLFINAKGLVMEIGGMMTHGSVIAREYGIPAVVCVDDATKKIRSGQRVRVDGTRGFVEVLAEPPSTHTA